MGGNALSIKTIRLDKSDYIKISEKISTLLDGLKFNIILSYKDKTTFGDIDVIIQKIKNFDYYSFIQRTFKPNEIKKNGSVYSFDYKNFQVDFIIIDELDFDCATVYYDYSPRGMLIGVLANQFDLKYGHNGLFYKYKTEWGIREVLLTRNQLKIYDLLKLNKLIALKGYYSQEDIFDWISESIYFKPSLFELKNLSHKNRNRNKKRKDYSNFLSYIQNNKLFFNKGWYSDISKEEFFDTKIKVEFPHLLAEMRKIDREIKESKEIRSKFNGQIAHQLAPSIPWKELGPKIKEFKNKYDILSMDQDKIKDCFITFCQNV